MAECACIPLTLGAVWCCFRGTSCITSTEKKNKILPYDDERPRKMTPYEYQMYCLHMNAYGRHISK